jgi:hypothetical protein
MPGTPTKVRSLYPLPLNISMYQFKYFIDNIDKLHQPHETSLTSTELTNDWRDHTFSFSQAGQDLFVVAMLQGKCNGTFLELGGFSPKYGGNNTYILEKKFNFSGTSIDINYDADGYHKFEPQLFTEEVHWPLCRPNTKFYNYTDALTFDYSKLAPHFDYLQVDLDEDTSLPALERVLKTQEFSVITFEHDVYNETKNPNNKLVKEQSQKILNNLGYELVINNATCVADSEPDKPLFFEDWYANPLYIPKKVIEAYKWTNENDVKYYKDILFKKDYTTTKTKQ